MLLLLAHVTSTHLLPVPLGGHERRLATPVLFEYALLGILLLLDEHHLAVGEVEILAVVQRH